MDERRSDAGRRAGDDPLVKVQKDVMLLVTATRESQRGLAKLEIEVGKLSDHVEDVDDHLRGVAGRDSLDTRVALLEKEFVMHGVLLKQISDQFSSLHVMMEEIKADVSVFKITKAVSEKVESTNTERLKEWLKFWGPIILVALAWVRPVARFVVDQWTRLRTPPAVVYRPDERLRKAIAADKIGQRGKKVKEKLAALERATTSYQP